MMRVGAHAVARELAIDRRATCLRVIVLFQHENSGAFSEDKAVTSDVPRPAGSGRIVVTRRQRARGAESADAKRRDARFGSTGDHDLGVAVFDQPGGFAETVVSRRACADGREIRPFVTVVDRHQARDHVDNRSGNKERRNLAHAAMRVSLLRLLDHRQSADAGSNADADAFLVPAIIVEPGISDGFHRRNESEMIEGVVATRLLR